MVYNINFVYLETRTILSNISKVVRNLTQNISWKRKRIKKDSKRITYPVYINIIFTNFFYNLLVFLYNRGGSLNRDASADAENHWQHQMIDAGDPLVILRIRSSIPISRSSPSHKKC